MANDEDGRRRLKELADKVRARTAVADDSVLHARGLAMVDMLAKDLAGPDGMPGLKVFRDRQELLKMQRERRSGEVYVEWRREIGALALSAEKNGTRTRAIHYVFEDATAQWRRLESTGELYEDLVTVLTEYLYPEGR